MGFMGFIVFKEKLCILIIEIVLKMFVGINLEFIRNWCIDLLLKYLIMWFVKRDKWKSNEKCKLIVDGFGKIKFIRFLLK